MAEEAAAMAVAEERAAEAVVTVGREEGKTEAQGAAQAAAR